MSSRPPITICNPTPFLMRTFPGPWFNDCDMASMNRQNPFRGPVSFVDETTFIIDDGDETKRFKFQADGIDPGVTRTYRVPNQDTDLVGTNVEQILTNKVIVGPSNMVGATQFETSNPSVPVIINGTAPAGAGEVLVTTSAGTAEWADVNSLGIGGTVTYTLIPGKISVFSTGQVSVAYFPWLHSRYNCYTDGILIFNAIINDRMLDIELYDNTNSVVLASQTGITVSGVYSLPLATMPTADASLLLRVNKDINGGNNPIIEGCSLEFSGC